MKKELQRLPNMNEIQNEILQFWKEDNTFVKSVDKSHKGGPS